MKNTNKLPRTSITAKIKFYFWLVSIGADVKDFESSKIEIHQLPAKRKSSFKKRATEIKEKYNYNFKFREQDWIGSYPNIESLTFNRKTA